MTCLLLFVQYLGFFITAARQMFRSLRKPAMFGCLVVGFVIPASYALIAQDPADPAVVVVQEAAETPQTTDETVPQMTAEAEKIAEPPQQDVIIHRGNRNDAEKKAPLPPLIQDIGLILIVAAVMLLIFKWLRQPVILGYLFAGLIVGPNFLPSNENMPLYQSYEWLYQYLPEFVPKILTIQDSSSIHVWAELGVIFILFGLGLEFSFKKLLGISRAAANAGGFAVIATTIIGFFVGRMFGWDPVKSIFFGAMLAMSSSTVIHRVFDDLKWKGKEYAPIVFGSLIVEDLLAVLLLVLLSSIALSSVAMSDTFSGGELFFASAKLFFFFVLWLVMGILLLPWFLRWCKKILNDELLMLVSVGLCFLMVMVACGVGFTSALGAFVMGSVLAETSRGARIEHLMRPIKNLFLTIFFVYVGMQIEPVTIWELKGEILIITALTVFIKFFATGLGALIAGYSIRNSMCAGMSMAQIGEFAFIIATIGKWLGVIEADLFSILVVTSAITMLTTPYLIRTADSIARWLEDHVIPERFMLVALRYEIAMDESTDRENIPHLFWRTHGLEMTLNTVVIISIVFAVMFFVGPLPEGEEVISPKVLIFLSVAGLLSIPCLWGVFRGRALRPEHFDAETLSRLHQLQFGIYIIRFLTGSILVVFIVGSFLELPSVIGLTMAGSIVFVMFLFGSSFDWLYHRIETRFVSHLSDKERSVVEERTIQSHLVPWKATLTEFTLSEYSPLVMKTLQGSDLKQGFGVTVAVLKRGGKSIVAPRADEPLLPRDALYLIGTFDQLAAAQAVIEFRPNSELEYGEEVDEEFGMVPLRLRQDHLFVGKMIRECGIREAANGLIVGLERSDERILNPDPSMILQENDLIWIVGERSLLEKWGRTATESSGITSASLSQIRFSEKSHRFDD